MKLLPTSLLLAVLCASARADDADAALRRYLARGAGPDRSFVRVEPAAHLATTPGGAMIARSGTGAELQAIDQHERVYRVVVYAIGATLALWLDESDVVPSVVREIGVASSPSAKVPGPEDDGLFLEPGVQADGERKGDRVHVRSTWDGVTVDGWIPVDAVDARYSHPSFPESGWKHAARGTTITVGGHVIATAQGDVQVRSLRRGRGELVGAGWRARGKLTLAGPPDDGGVDGAEGGVDTGPVDGDVHLPMVPLGACLYDDDGHLVGAVDRPDGLAHVTRTASGFDVEIDGIAGTSGAITLHARRYAGDVERCLP